MSRRGWLLVVGFIASIGAVLAAATAGQPDAARNVASATDADLRALIDAGRYIDAEKQGLARVTTLEEAQRSSRKAGDTSIADTLDLVLEARHLGRRLTQPDTVELAERALGIKEAAFGPDDPRVASTLVLAGLARGAQRQFDAARLAINRALAIRERTLGPDHLDVANALNALGVIERISGRTGPSSDAATRALAIANRAERPEGRETAVALQTLGYAAHSNGQVDLAVRRFEEAVGIEERLYGPGNHALFFVITQLGIMYGDAGDLDRSLAQRERALRLLESTPGSDYRLSFELMMHSNWMNRIGDYAASLGVAERAVTLAERATGPQSQLSAAALEQLAITHSLLGNYAAAAAINQKAVALWTATQGRDNLHTAKAWQNLAVSYEDGGRIDDAFEAVEQAITIPTLAKEPLSLSEGLRCKARLLMARGRFDEAREILIDTRRRLDEAAPTRYRRTAAGLTLLLMGRLEREEGRPDRAVALYREALELLDESLGPGNPRNAPRRAELAAVLAETGERVEVRRLLIDSERIGLDHLRLLSRALPDQAALGFAASRTSGIDLAVTLATTNRVDSVDIDLAFDLLVRGRTVILDEMAARRHAVAQGAADPALRERWTTLNRARTRLANLIVRGPEQHPIERYQALVVRARIERDQAERDLAQASAAFRQEQQRTNAGRQEVLAHLPSGAAIVSYVRYTPRPLQPSTRRDAARSDHPAATSAEPAAYAAFVARPGRPIAVVPLGDAGRIDSAIELWRDRIRGELTSAGLASRRGETMYRDAGAALRTLVWDPVRTHLGKAGAVFIVPDGALHLVDLSTLPTGRTAYLADAPMVLHYLLAERDVLQPASAPASDSLLALAAPDFNTADRSMAIDAAPIASNLAPSVRGASVCDASLPGRFDPLPATQVEVQHIANLWRRGLSNGSEVVVLGGGRASEAAFKTLAPGRRVLHVATHGFFLDRQCTASPATPASAQAASAEAAPGQPASARTAPADAAPSSNHRALDENPLLRSGLILAGANQRAPADTEDDDGILTAEEIAGLDLSGAQWAVLSACDTGRGDWQAGEGVLGLRRAFQVAGARTVVLSLWPVLDTVTSQWMTELYRRKWASRGTTTSAAVRGASRALLAERRMKGESTHPLYWSGFIATGDWR